jgi:FRG domain
MIRKNISGVGDFLKKFSVDYKSEFGAIWFRGHADKDWSLLPGLLRNVGRASEGTLLAKFRQRAAMLADQRPATTFEWTFLMQHYGVPTRLLDWTESPLVALYFAVESFANHVEKDAVLWCLYPTVLNKAANVVNDQEPGYIPSFEDEELESYSLEKLSGPANLAMNPLATIATRNNPRIQAQLGTFTIHHAQKTPIDKIGKGEHLIKYTILSDKRADILSELKLLGLNKFSLFPEIASVGEMLKENHL